MSAVYRVLFPIDFASSWRTPPALWQIMMTRQLAEVTLLHVLDGRWNSARENRLERAVTRMDIIAQRDFPGACVVRRIERGNEVDQILERIRSTQTDLVVLPGRTASWPGERTPGQVAREIFREAPCSIWLDDASAPAGTLDTLRARPICCSIEGNDSDEYVLQEAARLASDLGARLTIVYALWAEPGKSTSPLCDPYTRRREIQSAEMRIDKLRRRFAPKADLQVEVGIKESVLSQVIRRHKPGLLVTVGDDDTAALAAESVCPVWRLARKTQCRVHIPIGRAAFAGQERRIA